MSGCDGDHVAQKADSLYPLALEEDVHVYRQLYGQRPAWAVLPGETLLVFRLRTRLASAMKVFSHNIPVIHFLPLHSPGGCRGVPSPSPCSRRPHGATSWSLLCPMGGGTCLELVVEAQAPGRTPLWGVPSGLVPSAHMGNGLRSHLHPFSPFPIPLSPSPPQLLLGSPPSQMSCACSRRGKSPESNGLGFIQWLPGAGGSCLCWKCFYSICLMMFMPWETRENHFWIPWKVETQKNPVFGGIGVSGRGGPER